MTLINLTTGNPNLGRIKAITSTKDFVSIPFRSLAKADKVPLEKAFPCLFGRQLKGEDVVLTVQFENTAYKRCYPLSLYQSESGGLVTRLGKEVVPLNIQEDVDIELRGVKLDRYEDPCLIAVVEDGNNFIELPLVIRFDKDQVAQVKNEDKSINYNSLKKLWKKPDKFARLLMVAKEYSGGESTQEMTTLSELPEYKDIPLLKARQVKTSFGPSFIITVKNPDNGAEAEMWAPYALKEFLLMGAKVGDNTTFQFYSYANEKAKSGTSYNINVDNWIWEETEDTAQLDELFALA